MIHEATAYIWNYDNSNETQKKDTYSYDQYWALKLGEKHAFDAYWLDPDFIIGEIDTPFISVLKEKYKDLPENQLKKITSKYHPKTEVSHNILKKFWYELVAIMKIDDTSRPDYMCKRPWYIDWEEIEFDYKENENFFKLIYSKALQSRYHTKVESSNDFTVRSVLKILFPNK
jgi:hypothetical protein